MVMLVILKIASLFMFISLIGCLYNAIKGKDMFDWRNNIYSIYPAVFALLIASSCLIYKIFTL